MNLVYSFIMYGLSVDERQKTKEVWPKYEDVDSSIWSVLEYVTRRYSKTAPT